MFCFVLPGSPDLTNCLVTAALTLASSHMSAHCARRSLPAVTIYPNTRRSTAAPGPAGLSEPPCDTLIKPKPCPAPTHPAWSGFDQGGPKLPQDFWCFTSRTFRRILRISCCCPLIASFFSVLPAVFLIHLLSDFP